MNGGPYIVGIATAGSGSASQTGSIDPVTGFLRVGVNELAPIVGLAGPTGNFYPLSISANSNIAGYSSTTVGAIDGFVEIESSPIDVGIPAPNGHSALHRTISLTRAVDVPEAFRGGYAVERAQPLHGPKRGPGNIAPNFSHAVQYGVCRAVPTPDVDARFPFAYSA